MSDPSPVLSKRTQKTREKVLEAASRLFYQHGIRAVGVDAIVAEAGIAKMTLYNHFRSKDDLIVAYLEREKEKWLNFSDQHRESLKATTAEEQLLGAFDAMDFLLSDPTFDFRGCPFINICAEIPDPDHPARKISAEFNNILKTRLQGLARDAGCREHELVGDTLLCMLYGSLTKSFMGGNRDLARKTRAAAQEFIRTYKK